MQDSCCSSGAHSQLRVAFACLAVFFGGLTAGCAPPERNIADSTASPHAPAKPRPGAPPALSLIAAENMRPGTTSYQITQPALNHEVEGYASNVSALPGETVDLMVNVDHPKSVAWRLYRLGYYQGLGARLIDEAAAARVEPQPACQVDSITGLISCEWAPTFRATLSTELLSGQYLFKLTASDGFESDVPLLVRDATRKAALLVQSSVTTWQAYNVWGGTSLYDNFLPSDRSFTARRATVVSFDRPYSYSSLSDSYVPRAEQGAGQVFLSEVYMWRWLEERGYDVAYTTNIDVDREPETVLGRRVFLSVGHDEYWTVAERDALEAARSQGVSLAFFSGNAGYWRVRLDTSPSGVKSRRMTCFKGAANDPLNNQPDTTARFREGPFARPENSLEGVMYQEWSHIDAFPMLITNPTHWVFAGTGVKERDTLPNVVGYEWDLAFQNRDTPTGLEILSNSPVVSAEGVPGAANATVYYPTASSIVFAAGTISWAWGLSLPGVADTRIQRITENVLARAGLVLTDPTKVQAPNPSVSPAGKVTLIAGSGKAGYADGVGGVAQFDAPTGVTLAPDGSLLVIEAGANRLRRIDHNGLVTTVLDCGSKRAPRLCFQHATGVIAMPDGTVYISDTGHDRIIQVMPTGDTALFAGGLSKPRGLAVGPDTALYVADGAAGDVRRIDASGVATIAQGLGEPTAIAFGDDGTLYVLATATGSVYRLTEGKLAPITFQFPTGGGTARHLRGMDGLAVAGRSLVVSDTGNNRVDVLPLGGSSLAATALGDGYAGTGLPDDVNEVALPRGLTPFRNGFAVADSGNNRVIYFELE